MIKNINEFVAKHRFGKPIEKVLIAPDKIVATDAFKLIEIKHETGATEPILVKLPKGVKTFKSFKSDTNGEGILVGDEVEYKVDVYAAKEFPKYETVWPKDEPEASIKLNGKLLLQMAKAFSDLDCVEVHVHGKGKPIEFVGRDRRAILMPLNI